MRARQSGWREERVSKREGREGGRMSEGTVRGKCESNRKISKEDSEKRGKREYTVRGKLEHWRGE